MSQYEKDIVLPYNEHFQEAMIGHCILDHRFFLRCHEKIKGSWFNKIILANIFDQLCIYYKAYGKSCKSKEELVNQQFFLDNNDYTEYCNTIARCVYKTGGHDGFDLDVMKKQLTGFVRAKLFQESIQGAAARYKSLGLDDAYTWTSTKIKEISSATFEEDTSTIDFDDPTHWLELDSKIKDTAISTGCRRLDLALGGGLFKGETSAIMAPSNTGKSTFMITLVRHAIMQEKKVLFITHEDNPSKIRRKILTSYMGVDSKHILNPEMIKQERSSKLLNIAAEIIKERLAYIPYNKTGEMYIEDVASLIKKKQEDEILKTGKGFDIVIDDYPKKLKTRNKHKNDAIRTELAEVYDYFNQLAVELDVHCFVAIQTNRAGLKQNMGKEKSDHYIGMDMVDESYGIAQNMGNIITLNRSPEAKQKRVLHLSITKSRNDQTDVTVTTRTAYNCSLTHGDRDMFIYKTVDGREIMPGYFNSIDCALQPDPMVINGLASTLFMDNKIVSPSDADILLSAIEAGGKSKDDENFRISQEQLAPSTPNAPASVRENKGDYNGFDNYKKL
jgi:replicative DNA helicase